jgi:hypothetical protein
MVQGTPVDLPECPPGPFALLISLLWHLTGEPSLTLATLWANHEGTLD